MNFRPNRSFFFIFWSNFTFLLITGCGNSLKGQNLSSNSFELPSQFIELFEELTEINGIGVSTHQLMEEWTRILDSRIDLNKVNISELEELLFLSTDDIQSIISYRDRYGPFISLYEIQAIPRLTIEKARLLYGLAIPPEKENYDIESPLLDYPSTDIRMKFHTQLEKEKGFTSNEGNTALYEGDRSGIYSQWTCRWSERLSWGITLEKDPGEKIFTSHNISGFDHESFYITLKKPFKKVDKILIGDYRPSMGQGLIIDNRYRLAKTSLITSIKKNNPGSRPHKSSGEYNYFRGISIAVRAGSNLTSDWFISSRSLDATLRWNDNLNKYDSYSTFRTSGLHRTSNELLHRSSVKVNAFGGILEYGNPTQFSLRFNYLFTQTNLPRKHTPRIDNFHDFNGNSLLNVGMDFDLRLKSTLLFGETAVSQNGGNATTFGLLTSLHPNWDLSMLFRKFQPHYQSHWSSPFAETNNASNEAGIYTGIVYRFDRHLSLRFYVDYWNNPWSEFNKTGSSLGKEYFVRLDYTQSKFQRAYLQLKIKNSQANITSLRRTASLAHHTSLRIRFHWENTSERIAIRTRVENSIYKHDNLTEYGFLIYYDLRLRNSEKRRSFSTRLAFFNIPSRRTSIFTFENDIPTEHSIQSFNGKGLRIYFNLSNSVSYALKLHLRLEQTMYLDRDSIGSGHSAIGDNTKTQIKILCQLKH